jgi:hypothetical protein
MRRVIVVVLSVVAVQSAEAAIITEDFEANGDPGVGGFDPAFNHRIDRDEFGQNTIAFSQFRASRFTSPGHSLFLAPATDYVTFNLNPGEYVDYAEVWMRSNQADPPGYFHVIGTRGELLQQTSAYSVTFARFDTSGANLGRIVEIRLTGYEGYFDDLRISVVPEPPGALLLAISAGLFIRRRKAVHVVPAMAALLLALTTLVSAVPVYQPGEYPSDGELPVRTESRQETVLLSPPGNESADVVFVLDGSGSIPQSSWDLEKWGVANCLDASTPVIPANGTVAVAGETGDSHLLSRQGIGKCPCLCRGTSRGRG